MIEWNDVTHRTKTHAACAGPGPNRIKARRGHPAFVGAKVVLDAEAVVKIEFVAQLQFAPELFVALVRRHSGLGPDMGKMRELHVDPLCARSVPGSMDPRIHDNVATGDRHRGRAHGTEGDRRSRKPLLPDLERGKDNIEVAD